MNRREMIRTTGVAVAALGINSFPLGWVRADDKPKRKLLFYTHSVAFEHPCIKVGKKGEPSHADKIVTALGEKHGFEVTCSKDGRIFLPETLKTYDAFLFETQGDLTKAGLDGQPPMLPEGKKALLDAIAAGKGFAGCHCAADTFHSPNYNSGVRWKNDPPEKIDPYIAMVGGEFGGHGIQQNSWMRVVDKKFPGIGEGKDFQLNEEWYSLMNFAPDLHVILVQDTEGMKNFDYERPKYPATWARKQGKGRVFYTSMGHREDVWSSERFQNLLLGGLSWIFGNVEADVTPNLKEVAPEASKLPEPKKK
ncbi:MAG TPA: ThuA domain-containing protein [Gemmataceae bacterium]|nr:ThuA domain-containing protein [Gemmataceae bacterium]